MTNRALLDVLLQRERLLVRIERQRGEVDACFAGLAKPVRVIDHALAVGRFLRSHPLAVAGVVAGAFVLRGRSLLGMATRGLGLWRLVRRAQALARHFGY